MRIDSLSFYTAGLSGILDNQSAMARLNQQIATGQALLAPKDDPQTMADIMAMTDSVAVRTQLATNQTKGDSSLQLESTVLATIHTTLNSVSAQLTSLTPSSDAQTRASAAQLLAGLFAQLKDFANTQDATGNYIFAGDAANTAPFTNSGGGIGAPTTYAGNTNTHSIEIDTGRYLQVSDNLDATVFKANTGLNSDLLQTIDQAVNDLNTGTITQAALNGYNQTVSAAITNLSNIEYRVAGAQTQLAEVKQTNQTLLTNEQNELSNLSQVNQAQAIVELQTRQTTLTAALTAFSQISSLSLFKFL